MKNIKNIKQYSIWFIIWITLVTVSSVYWSVNGSIGSLFEYNGSIWKLLWTNIKDNTISTDQIQDNTITENDISDNFKARDSNLLDGIDSTWFFKIGTSGDQILDWTIDSTEIQNYSLTASDIASNSIWNYQLNNADNFIFNGTIDFRWDTIITTPNDSNDITNKSYVDSQYWTLNSRITTLESWASSWWVKFLLWYWCWSCPHGYYTSTNYSFSPPIVTYLCKTKDHLGNIHSLYWSICNRNGWGSLIIKWPFSWSQWTY